jgi:inositol hexakisphosphate/diphosphoinositol-pentakisphosphate kinase
MCLKSDVGQRKFALNLQQEQELLFRLSTATTIVNPLNNNILRAVVGVFRHGDRTPKQKLKWKSEDAEMFALFNSFPNHDGEVKMRESAEKVKFLNVIQALKARESSNELVLRRYQCVEFVLEHDKQCKVQLKPKFKKSKDSPAPTEQVAPTLSSVQVVVKWGGALTHAGLKQSSEYGHTFRDQLFLTHNPSKRREFLRGLQAFTSDEDRVKETARAFCQSLLECDELPSDTLHESNFLDDMLDGVDAAKERVEVAKAQIQKV